MKQSLLFFFILFCNANTFARTFYINTLGNDANSGLTIASAWQSISKVNSTDFNANDTLLFEGGAVFNGNIYFSEEDSGTAAQPIVISSYGIGRATIFAGKSFGFYAYNVAGISIDNINFRGLAADSSTQAGIFFYTDNNAGKKYKHILLNRLDISGFKTGISLGSYHNTYPGFSAVRITNIQAFDNLENGISTYDIAEKASSLYAHDSFYIAHCYLNNNGFSGLVLGGVNYGLIERIKASRTGQLHNKGVVAIWAWSSKNLTFQYCIADSTRTDGGDGGGYDLDGGTENCTIQYCYSYFNDGPGYMHCDYPQSRPTKNNSIRYNITERDGQQDYRDKSSLLFISWGTGLQNCIMHNNTSYINSKPNGKITGLQAHILDGFDIAPNINSCIATNNIIYASGDSNYLVRFYNGATFALDTNAIKFWNNNYYATKPSSRRYNTDATTYTTLASWQTNTYQEYFSGSRSGSTADPLLQNAGTGLAILYPSIDTLSALLQGYTLLPASPMIDNGRNLATSLGIAIGSYDFFFNSALQGPAQDIGCYETRNTLSLLQPTTSSLVPSIYPNPCHSSLSVAIAASQLPLPYTITNMQGVATLRGSIHSPKQAISTLSLASGSYILHIIGQAPIVFMVCH